MPSKNVAVRMDVYEALRRERRSDESFTKLLLRLLNQRGPLDDLVGTWGSNSGDLHSRRWRRMRHGERSP